jgi:hypothetical protein
MRMYACVHLYLYVCFYAYIYIYMRVWRCMHTHTCIQMIPTSPKCMDAYKCVCNGLWHQKLHDFLHACVYACSEWLHVQLPACLIVFRLKRTGRLIVKAATPCACATSACCMWKIHTYMQIYGIYVCVCVCVCVCMCVCLWLVRMVSTCLLAKVGINVSKICMRTCMFISCVYDVSNVLWRCKVLTTDHDHAYRAVTERYLARDQHHAYTCVCDHVWHNTI